MRLKVLLAPEPEGGFSVAVPALPGCFTQGETEEEALANAREAAAAWLEASNDNPSPFQNGSAPVAELEREMEL
jgi:predicted RNase H-like HicB family nuclease